MTPSVETCRLTGSIQARLPVPPSVNTYYRSVAGRVLISRDGRQYRKLVSAACLAGGIVQPLVSRIAVAIAYYPADRRRRDLDNILKALLDALQHGGVYGDDSQIDILTIVRNRVGPDACVTVCVTPI